MSSRAQRTTLWLWLTLAAGVSLFLTVRSFTDPDAYWHLALGRYLGLHGFPSSEPFSFLPPARPWVGQQWLYELLLARVVDVGGTGLASLAMGVVASAALLTAALSFPRRRPRPPGPWAAACLLLSALVAQPFVGVRGQMVTMLGAAVVLHIMGRWRDGSTRWLWALPPILLLWANLHAGFVLGLVLPAVVALVHRPRLGAPTVRRRPVLVAVAASAALTLLNPAGPALYSYVAATFTDPAITEGISEWLSPNFHVLFAHAFQLEAAVLLLAWAATDGPELTDAVLAGGAFVASLQAQRNIALFAIIALPQLIRYGGEAWTRWRPRWAETIEGRWLPGPRELGALIAVLVLVLLTSGLPQVSAESAANVEAVAFPKGSLDYALAHFPGQRLYSRYEWGGYVAYRAPTGRVVFIYGESAIFGDPGLERYDIIRYQRPGWPAALVREGLHHAVVPARSSEVSALREVGWGVDCYDRPSDSLVLSLTAPPTPWTPTVSPPSCTGGG